MTGASPVRAAALWSLGAALVLVAALSGLAADARGAATREVTDMLGRRVRVPDHAARIVSLAPSIT